MTQQQQQQQQTSPNGVADTYVKLLHKNNRVKAKPRVSVSPGLRSLVVITLKNPTFFLSLFLSLCFQTLSKRTENENLIKKKT